jgi:hypothetical protein
LKEPTRAEVESHLLSLGMGVSNRGAYDLNIVGVRAKDRSTSSFPDWICVLYTDQWGNEKMFTASANTDPCTTPGWAGKGEGRTLIADTRYLSLFTLGSLEDRGDKGERLIQLHPCVVMNHKTGKKETLNPRPEKHMERLCLTRAPVKNEVTGDSPWEGHQTIEHNREFRIFLSLCREAYRSGNGGAYTYTLLNERGGEEEGV